jgi:hypothetical protein
LVVDHCRGSYYPLLLLLLLLLVEVVCVEAAVVVVVVVALVAVAAKEERDDSYSPRLRPADVAARIEAAVVGTVVVGATGE